MHGKKGGGLHMLTFILLVIGGLNWLLFGLFSWDVGQLFGGMDAAVSRIIYIIVGLSAIIELATHKKHCKSCSAGGDHSDSGSMNNMDNQMNNDQQNMG